LRFQETGQLGRGCGFSRSIESNDENACGFVEVEFGGIASKDGAEFFVKNFYDLLAWSDAAEDGLTECSLFDFRYEILCDLKVNICVQKRETNLTKGICNIRFTDLALPAEVFENVLKFIRESAKPGR